MAESRVPPNRSNDRLSSKSGQPPTGTEQAEQNFNAIRYGNDKGSLSFGHIHKQGDVTAGVLLASPRGDHQLSLDISGERTGWTCSTSPGNFQVKCGFDPEKIDQKENESLILNAENGNITILASNGKIRLQGIDIELTALGKDGSGGSIIMNANENVEIAHCKKFLVNSSTLTKLVSAGKCELSANSLLSIYGSIVKAVTDACSKKDSKTGNQTFQKENNQT